MKIGCGTQQHFYLSALSLRFGFKFHLLWTIFFLNNFGFVNEFLPHRERSAENFAKTILNGVIFACFFFSVCILTDNKISQSARENSHSIYILNMHASKFRENGTYTYFEHRRKLSHVELYKEVIFTFG